MSQKIKRFWQLFKSVAASAFGVQTQANYRRDFQQSSFLPFLLVGLFFVMLLVITLVALINWLLPA